MLSKVKIYIPPVAMILAGIGLSMLAFLVVHQREYREMQLSFEQDAIERCDLLKREIDFDLQTLEAITAFYQASEGVARSEFRTFVKPLLDRHPSIQALEWIPRVSTAQREPYEERAKRDGFPGFHITERGTQGQMVRARERNEYFPVYFVEPYTGNETALGFDLASNPTREGSLSFARATGKTTATSRVTLVQETANQPGVLVFAPVYRKQAPLSSSEDRRENLMGFVLGVFRISNIMEHALAHLNPKQISVSLYDQSAPEKDRFLHAYAPRIAGTTPMSDGSYKQFSYAGPVTVADRSWIAVLTPTPGYLAAKRSRQPWAVLTAGLLFTALLAGYLFININRARRIEGLVEERTRDLAQVNTDLHTEITERKQAERRQYLSAEILGILNDPLDLPELINRILAAIKRETGFDAVGIRLRDGDDFPYFVQNGFSSDFPLKENTLTVRAQDGGICKDTNGNPSLECTCGLVLSGQTDPANPLFTEGGSCWTNNTSPLLDLPADQDPRLHPRNNCIHQGYCSVALIPIRANRNIVGLLQLNDRKKDCFTLEMIHFFEGISASIGMALMRKQQEDALRESETLQRLLFDGSRDAMMIVAPPSWKFTSGNPAALEMFRAKDAAEFTALGPWDVSPERQPDGSPSADKAKEAIQAALREGYHFFEWTHRRLDGVDFPATVLLTRIEMAGQAFLQATVRDITAQKQAEERLREYEKVGENSKEMIVVVDHRYQYLLANAAFLDYRRLSREQVVGRSAAEVLGADVFESHVKKHLDACLQGETVQYEMKCSYPELGERHLFVSYFPIQGARGVTEVASIIQDITERKRAEEKIRASLKEKEVLLKEIHHRVKNNLQIISSLLFLQASGTEHPGAVSALQESRARVKSMALIHERLYQSPDLAAIDMGEYTRNLVSDLQHSYRTEDGLVRFTLNLEAIPLGITEAIPCGLIINELVSNALKHAFPKGREGEITVQLLRGNTNQIALSVSDNGIGFPEHVDFRKSPSLGLTLVNSLVDQLHGAIELDRRRGTAFRITFG